ncbi:KilA-N domain-containing protein [Achromobacter insuavis]|uniref:KilA-like protein n=1 Tax=Achromobacter insuavis AXX-A TaxID=1003200 RepID=F7TB76_9BURK|nr:KilA-N domain-containing protein [Achromobacter insuavis]EGP42433.1 KilA-like protein [Achromobacter insuavis AXX-A]
MTQIDLPVIPRLVEGSLIQQRAADGYINATAMCNAAGKKISHYFEVRSTKEFLAELALDTRMPLEQLVQILKGGNPAYQGTWVHPQVAIHLAQWLSPKFAVQVAKWVYEWMSGGAPTGATASAIPVHIQRYLANVSEIPRTHFSILNELTFSLVAPLEADGYSLPEKMVPDISQGRMFSDWLRKEKGIEPKSFPTYKHRYMDGRVVDARLYPNELLADFRRHFHEVWMPTKCHAYFAERDVKALPYLPKLLAAPKA